MQLVTLQGPLIKTQHLLALEGKGSPIGTSTVGQGVLLRLDRTAPEGDYAWFTAGVPAQKPLLETFDLGKSWVGQWTQHRAESLQREAAVECDLGKLSLAEGYFKLFTQAGGETNKNNTTK